MLLDSSRFIVQDVMCYHLVACNNPDHRDFGPWKSRRLKGPGTNVTILQPGSDATLFVGEVFGGPASRTYDVPALRAGEYPFRCDVHPEMAGTLIATPS
jgi:hypothetical protein